MKRKLLILCVLLVLCSGALTVFLASKQSSGQAYAANVSVTSSTTTVTISQFRFNPQKLTITVGTTVIWKNKDMFGHTVTSNDGKTFNHVISPGGSYRFTFTKVGKFPYHCTFHPSMMATRIVK
jgi:plastocyanin